ncbi:uronyl 2-sulfotransferase-like [Penaeus indicus]|uniref:uronyl 2-sulfotransferase-like n=1 Tax=Penaeus indicus TaxID=29960 RepID=UPI00300CB555
MSGNGSHIRLRVTCVCLALALLAYVGLTQWAIGHALLREHASGSAGSLPLAARPHPDDLPSHVNARMLFFNRVPKSGSEMLVLLLQWLQGQNTFRHIRLRNSVRRYLSRDEQMVTDPFQKNVGENLAWYCEQCNATMVTDPFQKNVGENLAWYCEQCNATMVTDPFQKNVGENLAWYCEQCNATMVTDPFQKNVGENLAWYCEQCNATMVTDPFQKNVGENLAWYCEQCNATSWLSFDRHVYFTNFSTLGLKMPVYLNLIRDPVEKAASRFYYSRVTPRPGAMTPAGYHLPPPPRYSTLEDCVAAHDPECTFVSGQQYDLSIPYFCGHEDYCRELNNIAALNTAKSHVERWYPVVGILEDLNATLAVLQDRLPGYFEGVLDLYYNQLLGKLAEIGRSCD